MDVYIDTAPSSLAADLSPGLSSNGRESRSHRRRTSPIDFKLQVNFVDPAEGARRRLLDDAEPEADEKISGEPTEGDRLP
jgi:hypothetical protein